MSRNGRLRIPSNPKQLAGKKTLSQIAVPRRLAQAVDTVERSSPHLEERSAWSRQSQLTFGFQSWNMPDGLCFHTQAWRI